MKKLLILSLVASATAFAATAGSVSNTTKYEVKFEKGHQASEDAKTNSKLTNETEFELKVPNTGFSTGAKVQFAMYKDSKLELNPTKNISDTNAWVKYAFPEFYNINTSLKASVSKFTTDTTNLDILATAGISALGPNISAEFGINSNLKTNHELNLRGKLHADLTAVNDKVNIGFTIAATGALGDKLKYYSLDADDNATLDKGIVSDSYLLEAKYSDSVKIDTSAYIQHLLFTENDTKKNNVFVGLKIKFAKDVKDFSVYATPQVKTVFADSTTIKPSLELGASYVAKATDKLSIKPMLKVNLSDESVRNANNAGDTDTLKLVLTPSLEATYTPISSFSITSKAEVPVEFSGLVSGANKDFDYKNTQLKLNLNAKYSW